MYEVTDKNGKRIARFEEQEPLRTFCEGLGWGEGHIDNLLEELEQSGASTVYADFNFKLV